MRTDATNQCTTAPSQLERFSAASVWFLAACVLSLLVACATEERTPAVSAPDEQKIRSMRLVDPQTWRAESDFFSADSGVHFRVEVITEMRVDTVPEVLVLTPPVVSPDSLSISGVALEAHDIVRGVFSYAPRSRSLDLNTEPGPGYTPYSEPALSPAGMQLAYLANDRNYHFWLVVVSWPECTLLVETPQIETRCTEFWGNALRWVSADSLELYMNLCQEDTWARASGSLETLAFGVDTVGIDVLEALRPSEP
jgi:hypothetical protein